MSLLSQANPGGWIFPGLVTILVGTAASVFVTEPGIEADLSTRATASLTATGLGWAGVRVDGRDATVTGTATSPEELDRAVAVIAAVPGIRSVAGEVRLAPLVSPFPFKVRREADAITLSGGIPDETDRARLIADASSAVPEPAADRLELLSGAPDPTRWRAATGLALRLIAGLDRGEVALADLELSLSGRAASAEDFDSVRLALADASADGLTVGRVELAPPLVAPYTWSAEFENRVLRLEGATPTAAAATLIAGAAPDGVSVIDRTRLGSGAPPQFAETAIALVGALTGLQSGRAEIADTDIRLDGLPFTRADADAVADELAGLGAVRVALELDPPVRPDVVPYLFAANKTQAGVVISGNIPAAANLDDLAARYGADAISALAVSPGAPDDFLDLMANGLEALASLETGVLGYDGTEWTLRGRAVSNFRRKIALRVLQRIPRPQFAWNVAVNAPPPPPAPVSPYLWSAARTETGISLAGNVPDPETHDLLAQRFGEPVSDAMVVSRGAPADFSDLARNGLDALATLQSGLVLFDGSRWTLSGRAADDTALAAALDAIAADPRPPGEWTAELTTPPPAPLIPLADPFVWRAVKKDGAVHLEGNVPSTAIGSYLALRAGEGMADGQSVARGAPPGFARFALAGLNALADLDTGTVSFDGARWSIAGAAPDRVSRDRALSLIGRAPAPEPAWHVALSAPEPVIVPPETTASVEPEPPQPEPPSPKSPETASAGPSAEPANEAPATKASSLPTAPENAPPDIAIPAPRGRQAVLSEHLQKPPAGEPEEPLETASIVAIEPEATVPATPGAPAAEPEEFSPPPVVASVAPDTVAPDTVMPDLVPVVPGTFAFSAERAADGAITLSGEVPNFNARRLLELVTDDVAVNQTRLGPDAPPGFLRAASVGLAALAELRVGHLAYAGGKWSFSGEALDAAARERALDRLALVPASPRIEVDVTVIDPNVWCRLRLGEFSDSNSILFAPGSTRLAAESVPALTRVAADLNRCPAAEVYIEGHTDADGTDEYNLALSLARAEAVVDELIELGVNSNRLYAVGYGESLPIASNQTSAGKASNRRIVFGIVEPGN